MRGFLGCVTAALSVLPVRGFVYPDSLERPLINLHDDAALAHADDGNLPEVLRRPTIQVHGGPEHNDDDDDAAADDDDEDAADPVDRWLDSSPLSDVPDGAVLTATLFNTLTVSAAPTAATSLPDELSFTFTPPPAVATGLPVLSELVSPLLPSRGHDFSHDSSQRPLGRLDRLWRSALTKLSAMSGLLCSQRHGGSGAPVQIPIGAPSQVHDHDAMHHDELAADELFLPSVTAANHHTSPSAHPSRALHTSTVIPTSTAAAAIPTAVLAAGVPTLTSLVPNISSGSKPLPSDASALSVPLGSKHTLALSLSIVVTVALTVSIFAYLASRNPRRRAERLARIEECRNRRIYAEAALKHRIRSWGSATFGRLWFVGSTLTTTQIVGLDGIDVEKELILSGAAPSVAGSSNDGDRLLREVANFRSAAERVEALVRAEEGFALQRASGGRRPKHHHPADRNRWRTYMWLFGGKRRRKQQESRARSGSLSSDDESVHSDGEKSGVSGPPPYHETEKYQQVDDRYLINVVTGVRSVSDRRSSFSSLVPTSPKEGSMTLGSHDGDFSEKEDV